jgi:hypothetical protein
MSKIKRPIYNMNITDENANTLEVLLKKINGFDLFYEMSDSTEVWREGQNNLNSIRELLKNESKEHVYKLLNEMGKKNFDRYLW